MRKSALFLLLAASAVPALAGAAEDTDRQSRQSARAERAEQRAERPQRAERTPSGDNGQRAARFDAMREQRQQTQMQQQAQPREIHVRQQQASPVVASDRFRRQQNQVEAVEGGERMRGGGGLMQRQRHVRTIPDAMPEVLQSAPATNGVQSTRHYTGNYGRWSGGWRNDSRYDWQRHRHSHRSKFRIGFYFDPFGYGYRRYSIGSSIWPNYYQSRYYINDPWQYRLPPAYGPYRWVRYHNDALLIDTWTGQVVDVIYGFFW